MHIVLISHKPPFPSIDGGCIATANMIQNLQKCGYTIKLFCFATDKHPFPKKEKYPKWFKDCQPEYEYINTKTTFGAAVKAFFSSTSYFISRFKSEKLKIKITDYINIKQPDAVQIESLYSFLLVDFKKTNQLIAYRSHNIEHQLWEDRIKAEKNVLKRLFLKNANKKLHRFEENSIKKVDACIALTDAEGKWILSIRKTLQVQIIQLGFPKKQKISDLDLQRDLFYIGAFDWAPNVEGMDWFVEKVFPIIKKKQPGITLHIAGKNLDKGKYIQHKGINNYGEIKDKTAFFNAHGIMILPLFSGSGLRIKLIEALFYGKAIVATNKAAEGIAIEPGITAFLSDETEEFVNNVLKLYEDETLFIEMGKQASQFAEKHFYEAEIQEKLKSFYNTLLNK